MLRCLLRSGLHVVSCFLGRTACDAYLAVFHWEPIASSVSMHVIDIVDVGSKSDVLSPCAPADQLRRPA